MRQLSPSRRRLAKLQIDRVDTQVDDVSRIHRRDGHGASIDTTIPAGKPISALQQFSALGVDFISYTQNIDATTPMGRLFYHVIGSFAEFERALINERQREGIALAKQQGAYKGRKQSLSQAAVAQLRERLTTGISKAQLAREFGISRQTLYQYLRGGEGTS
jgi:DNA invertase Pin-like site-specific DNA recombinase